MMIFAVVLQCYSHRQAAGGTYNRQLLRPALQGNLLRGICIHNKSHNLPLILRLNYAYIFPGVGMSSVVGAAAIA